MRPAQPAHLDDRTHEAVDLLFSFRGRPLGELYLNKPLIPLLGRKAGVPRDDARGPITSVTAPSS